MEPYTVGVVFHLATSKSCKLCVANMYPTSYQTSNVVIILSNSNLNTLEIVSQQCQKQFIPNYLVFCTILYWSVFDETKSLQVFGSHFAILGCLKYCICACILLWATTLEKQAIKFIQIIKILIFFPNSNMLMQSHIKHAFSVNRVMLASEGIKVICTLYT